MQIGTIQFLINSNFCYIIHICLYLFQGSFKGVLRKFKGVKGCLKSVAWVVKGCFKGVDVSWKFQGCFQSVLNVFQGSFKKIFKVIQRSFMLHITHRSYTSRRKACSLTERQTNQQMDPYIEMTSEWLNHKSIIK